MKAVKGNVTLTLFAVYVEFSHISSIHVIVELETLAHCVHR